METRLKNSNFYPLLFSNAYGSSEITSSKVAKALAQFVRSMVSYQAKFDTAFNANGDPRFAQVLTQQEQLGLALFKGQVSARGVGINCSFCHGTTAIVRKDVQNIGLPNLQDQGAGAGRFKAPSLRNVGVRRNFMHDGRFNALGDVIDHYSRNISPDPNLSIGLLDDNLQPKRPNYSREEKDALIAFLNTLTDQVFINSPLFSNAFRNNPNPPANPPQNNPPVANPPPAGIPPRNNLPTP